MIRWLLSMAALLIVSASPAPAAEQGDPQAFVRDLGAQAIHILQTENSPATRKAAFLKVFSQNFDAPTIGRFVLGRYWKSATPEQQKQYVQSFSDYVVALYAARFSGYSGEQFKVLGSRQVDPTTYSVSSQIIQTNGGPTIMLGWQIAHSDQGFRITDVTVDNLSLSITKRDEFASVLAQNGGDVQALIDMLRQKVKDS